MSTSTSPTKRLKNSSGPRVVEPSGCSYGSKRGPIERFVSETQVPDFDLKIDLPNLDELIMQRRFIWWVTSPVVPRSSTHGQEIRIERSWAYPQI